MKNNIILLFVLANMYVSAQTRSQKDPNEISIHIGGGLSSIHDQVSGAKFINGYSFDFGIGYTYFFHQNLGLYVGVAPGIYHTRKNAHMDVFTPDLTDRNGYRFDLYTQFNYHEAFKNMFLNIPVMLQFQTKQKGQLRYQNTSKSFYAMAGIKAAIPLKDRYQSEIKTVTNAAYYPEFNNWAATQRFAGLGTFDDRSSDNGNLNLKTPCIRLAFEVGVKWRFKMQNKNNYLLYTGMYCDFGLNTTTNNIRTPMRNYIAVDHITDFTLLTFSDRINMMTAGVVVRLAFSQQRQSAVCSYVKTVREPVRKMKR